MAFVHTLAATPPERFDGDPWTLARFEESADNASFALVEVLAVDPVDADPESPALRHLTTTQADLEEGYFRIVWLDAAGNSSPPSASVYSPGTDADDGYPTVDALVAASSGPARVALDALDATQLSALRRNAIAGVEAIVGQAFTQEGDEIEPIVKLVDGSGTDRVYLPRRLAILTGVTLDGHLLASGDVALDPSGRFIRMVSPLGGSWVTRARRSPYDPAPVWDAGAFNVAIAGVWGWLDAEWSAGELAAVETAIRFDMEDQVSADAHQLAETVKSARALGLSAISQGNMSLSFRAGSGAAAPVMSSRVRRHLLGKTPGGRSLRWGNLPSGAVA